MTVRGSERRQTFKADIVGTECVVKYAKFRLQPSKYRAVIGRIACAVSCGGSEPQLFVSRAVIVDTADDKRQEMPANSATQLSSFNPDIGVIAFASNAVEKRHLRCGFKADTVGTVFGVSSLRGAQLLSQFMLDGGDTAHVSDGDGIVLLSGGSSLSMMPLCASRAGFEGYALAASFIDASLAK